MEFTLALEFTFSSQHSILLPKSHRFTTAQLTSNNVYVIIKRKCQEILLCQTPLVPMPQLRSQPGAAQDFSNMLFRFMD